MSAPMPEIVQGDARALDLPDASVDLVVTSPPYFGLRDYGTSGQLGAEPSPAEYIAALIECTREMMRVLKPSGSIFVNLGDKYSGSSNEKPHTGTAGIAQPGQRRNVTPGIRAPRTSIRAKSLTLLPERYRIAAVDELGLIARAVLIWSKPNGLPESVTDRVRRSHEDWVHLTKSPRYFAAVDEIREPHATVVTASGAVRYRKAGDDVTTHRQTKDDKYADAGMRGGYSGAPSNPLGKLPGSVWTIPTQPLRVPAELGVDHFAAFPMEWPRRLIAGWSPVGGTVLDPFGGTGTTALVAAMNGRRGISVDLSEDYQRLAEWRAQDEKQRAKAAGGSAQSKEALRLGAVGDLAQDAVRVVGGVPELVAGGEEGALDQSSVLANEGRGVGALDVLLSHASTVARAPRSTEEGAA